MKNKQFFVLIILLIIGFASVSTTLIINGKAKVAANIDDFDVVFIDALLDGEDSNNVEIDSTKKRLTFTTKTLSNQGDITRLDYKVKNTSTQYDADVTINCTNEENSYIEVTSSFDGQSLPLSNSVNMEAQEIKNGYINAKLIKPTTEDKEILITCTINVNATSRTNYAYSLKYDTNGGTPIEDKRVEFNSQYGELGVTERIGYTFMGWYDENGNPATPNTVLDTKGDKVIYARWSEKAYPITIVKNYPNKSDRQLVSTSYGEKLNANITIDEEYFIDNIECDNGYTIEGFNRDNIVYGNQSITISNNNNDTASLCTFNLLQGIYEYSYTGAEQTFSVPYDGNYKVELWGAQSFKVQGKGAYTAGEISLPLNTKIYVYVGQQGGNSSGGFNGGGSGRNLSTLGYYYGGGATDIRLKNGNWNNFDSLKSRIMVSAGGGLSLDAGGLVGYSYSRSDSNYNYASYGGTQTSGGSVKNYDNCGTINGTAGGFGYGGTGGNADSQTTSGGLTGGSGGGSGYYGGGGSSKVCAGVSSSGGGSSFISGHNGCDAIAESSTSSKIIHTGQPNHYSGYVFTNTVMIDGTGYNWTTKKESYTGMPTYDGKSTMTGNDGNGFAKITYLGK